ncbi:WxL domain-containing protein [Vagococcus intermedius]|uniref:WxL domain-containing protein n=1 Tax=Vagococcus intermedius TaxID=2991418 RepID=A0AAF0I9N0_9ENTE|nr:WxL domain-containing protein [Vagococcus intermedius]WEG73592.1 WxL domain-containing protein [Vagococcus intermedius]WEG75676.1 WxL domain-containing protein [Vagococcus intermedius]
MSKFVTGLLVSVITVGGMSAGVVVNAAEVSDKNDSKGSVAFEAGKLEFVTPQDLDGEGNLVNKADKSVPDFRFEKQKVGQGKNDIPLIKESAAIAFAGLTDFSGNGAGWTVKLQATDFSTKNGSATPGYPETKAVSPSLTGLVINIENTVKDIFASDGSKTDAKGVPAAVNANGDAAVTIAEAPTEGESQFLFDLSKTTLDIPAKDARKAQATVDYTSNLTWTVEANVESNGQTAALPSK